MNCGAMNGTISRRRCFWYICFPATCSPFPLVVGGKGVGGWGAELPLALLLQLAVLIEIVVDRGDHVFGSHLTEENRLRRQVPGVGQIGIPVDAVVVDDDLGIG